MTQHLSLLYRKPDQVCVPASMVIHRVLKEKIFDASPEDVNIYIDLAKLITEVVLSHSQYEMLNALIAINPEAISQLTSLVYMGIKMQQTQQSNQLELMHESPSNPESSDPPGLDPA